MCSTLVSPTGVASKTVRDEVAPLRLAADNAVADTNEAAKVFFSTLTCYSSLIGP